MASPSELSPKAIRDYILIKGGKVTNHDLVKYFKCFLTDPRTKEDARLKFKEYVNSVAVIRNDEEGEKFLYLKKKYRDPNLSFDTCISPPTSPFQAMSLQDIPSQMHSPGSSIYDPQDFPSPSQFRSSPRQPPPYRAPPPVTPPLTQEIGLPPPPPNHPHAMYSPTAGGSMINLSMESSPPVPPRRKSSDKIKVDKENQDSNSKMKSFDDDSSQKSDVSKSDEPPISVKERLIKFNRLLSESELPKIQGTTNQKKKGEKTTEEEDSSFANTELPKAREWLLACARNDYQTLAKLASENPRLTKYKDTASSGLHWAAKHGSQDLVKLLAGTHKLFVNERSGYTALHIAMQFGHEEVFDLLVHYGADPHLRDWSGRKARQYLASKDTSVSADTFRKIKKRKKHAEKDSGFLRIGSLNVRVKKTTEAFSNFLGVGSSYNSEKVHKSWGSADNLSEPGDRFSMPPPSQALVKKRKSRRGAQDFTRRRTPSDSPRRSAPPSISGTPSPLLGSDTASLRSAVTPTISSAPSAAGDSDSDTACGFGTNWQST